MLPESGAPVRWSSRAVACVDATGERVGRRARARRHVVEVGAELDAATTSARRGGLRRRARARRPARAPARAGHEEAETIETGARAAARGGFTAVVAMPNTDPPLDDAAVVASVLARGRRRRSCDVVSSGCITEGRAGDAARADGRAVRARRAHLHRRRRLRRRRRRDAPRARVRRRRCPAR